MSQIIRYMIAYPLVWVLFFVLSWDCVAAEPEFSAMPAFSWRAIEPGLELSIVELGEATRNTAVPVLVVLRINPTEHPFVLSMASEAGGAHSLPDWAERDKLRAGINASMYLQDNVTSIGYMRNGESVNNRAMGGRLGAFFVASGKKPELPRADIIERDDARWRERLDEYSVVVQNFRFLGEDGKLLWCGERSMHSIAVVAKERSGSILFILCQKAMTPGAFARYLKSFPFDLERVMYVEGGAHAGLFVRLQAPAPERKTGGASWDTAMPGAAVCNVPGGTVYVWKGRHSVLNTPSNPLDTLPNIIGVKQKE